MRARTGLVAALGLLLAATGCGPGTEAAEEELTVLAAASLTEPFGELADRFERAHPQVRVATSFDSSATIATQVEAGAPADVVATADPRTMQMMAGTVDEPVTIARNELALVVPRGNPAAVSELADLQGVDFVACAPAAPCGALAADLLDEAGITRAPRSHEVDVKAVLTKVMLDEADAGLVYASDVVAAGGRVEQVPLPSGTDTATRYPMAVVSGSDAPELAQEWVDLVLSREGQQVLSEAGLTAADESGTAP